MSECFGGLISKPYAMPELIMVPVFLLLFGFYTLSHACNQLDHDSLFSLSLNVSASPALNWSSSTDCCLWEGVHCDRNNRVSTLRLPSRGIRGAIPITFADLEHLTHLNLSHNHLSGPLPQGFFSSLHQLETLDLSYNNLSGVLQPFLRSSHIKSIDVSSNYFEGVIPSSFFQIAENLIRFNASNNTFSGPIPTSMCNNSSRSIRILDFSYNDISGQIPPTLGKCSKLQVLRVGFNSLSGPIPNDIYSAVELMQLSLPVNYISGSIGEAIINLVNLRTLELYSNQLSGLIPKDVGKLSKLEHFLLHINNFSGSLPASLMNCTNLIVLNLRVNQLGGDLTTFDFSTLTNLQTIDLGNNKFSGNLPVSLFTCKSLITVRLAGNKLGGQIPPETHALQSLSFISLSNNSLTNISSAIKILMLCRKLSVVILTKNFENEAFPDDDSIGFTNGFQNLQILALGGCQLTGRLPAWLAKLKKLQVLDLSVNQITGAIPSWLKSLPSLFYIDFSGNFMWGGFPKELAELQALTAVGGEEDSIDRSYLELPVFVMVTTKSNQQYNQLSHFPPAIYLRSNSLSGDIPIEISQLKRLHVLDLSNNNFSGIIPEEMSKLTNMEKLDLSGNLLSGEIPTSLISLTFLSSFNVASNDLQGSIPSGGQFDTFPSSSFEGNPGLCGPVVNRPCTYQPENEHPIVPEKCSKNTLVLGLIAGLVFGFIVGSAGGLLFPIHRLKFLSRCKIQMPRISRRSDLSSFG
ncbi:putative Leucine-rich repeat receptor protein kinase EXS precursor [Tripterygium wilfordii]|uniref:Putative Leucine-rich repeat receptor protein kinase EXS n=1 Tax=Tripterygium wilfordii TaxID=458696 RepID=A0A7J7CH15_TRIWF|nr:receptor-like protein 2 [Tripterygium wilfordii]KAF5733319.1 putative Leucine-rich repeat receptor protein kinase EXS precursor [Tripterygium wilfordii]